MTMVAVAGLFCSCSEDECWDKYHFEKTQYSFAQAAQSYNELSSADTIPTLAFTVYRSDAKGEVTIPVNVMFSDTIMSVSTDSVTFADGETSASLVVNVDNANVVVGTAYKAQATIAVDSVNIFDDNLSVSGPTTATISFKKNYEWTEWAPYGVGTYVYGEILFSGNDPDRQVLYRGTTGGELGQFVICGVMYGVDMLIDYVPATGACSLAPLFTGYTHTEYGDIYVADLYYKYGESYDNFPCIYDKEKGEISLWVVYYCSAGRIGYGIETFTFTSYAE